MKSSAEHLIANAKQRSGSVVARLREARAAIEADIEKNSGIYPFNAGRLNQAEVCRRAGVHPITLYSLSHKDTTLPMLQRWIKELKRGLITGKKSVRKAVTQRADDWKMRFEASADWVHRYHVEQTHQRELLEKAQETIREREAKIQELQNEVQRLHEERSQGKVIPLKRSKKDR